MANLTLCDICMKSCVGGKTIIFTEIKHFKNMNPKETDSKDFCEVCVQKLYSFLSKSRKEVK